MLHAQPYQYEALKSELFDDNGQRMFLAIRDNVMRLLNNAGAFQAEKAWAGVSGSTHTMLACLDRLVELGEIVEIKGPPGTWGQHRIFIRAS